MQSKTCLPYKDMLIFRMTFPEILDLNRFCELVENGEAGEVAEAGAESDAASGVKTCGGTTSLTTDSGDEGEGSDGDEGEGSDADAVLVCAGLPMTVPCKKSLDPHTVIKGPRAPTLQF